MPAVEASSVLTVATAPTGEGLPQSASQVSRVASPKKPLWKVLRDRLWWKKATGGTKLTGHLDQPELCDMEQVAKELRASWMRGNEENEEAAKALEEILNAALSEDQEQGTGQKLQALNDFARRKNAGGGLSSTDFNCAFPKDGRITFDTTASNIVFEANARETALISKDDLESFTFFTPLWFRQQLLSHGKSDRERVKKIAGMLIQARRKSTGDGGCQRIAQAVAERLRTGSIMFTELEYEAFKHILSAALREEENAATLEKFKQLFEEVAPDVWQQVKKFYWDSGECSTAKIVFEKETGNIVFDTTKLGDTIEPKTILIEGDALKNFKFYGYNGNEKKNAYRDTRQFASALNTSAALNEIRETGGEGGLLKLLGQAREELTGGNCQTQDMEQLQNVFRGFWGEGKFDRQTVNSGLQPLANDVLVEYLEHAGGLAAETSAWPKLRKFVKRTLDCQIATSQGIASEWRRGDSWQRFAVEMGETTLLDYSAGSFNPSPEERFLGPLSFRKALSEAMWKPKYGEESSHAPRKNLECLMDVAYKRSSGNIKEPTGGAAFNDCMMGKITNDLKNAWSGSSKFAGETDEENSDGARALKEILQSSIGIENEEKMVSLGTFFMKKKFPIAEKFPIAGVDGTIETGWRAKIGWSQTQTLRTHTHYPETDTSIVLRLEKTADGGKLKEYKLIELFDLKMGQDNSASGRIERDAEYPKFAEALQQRDRNTGDKAIAGELLCLLKAADEKARNMDKEAQALAVAPYREGRSEEKDIQHLRNVELPNPEDYDKAAQAKFRKCQGEQGQAAKEENKKEEAPAEPAEEEEAPAEPAKEEAPAEPAKEEEKKEVEVAADPAKEEKKEEVAADLAKEEKKEEAKEEAKEEKKEEATGQPAKEEPKEEKKEEAKEEEKEEASAEPAKEETSAEPAKEEAKEEKKEEAAAEPAKGEAKESAAKEPVEPQVLRPEHATASTSPRTPPQVRGQDEARKFLAKDGGHQSVQGEDVAGPKHVQVNVRASPVVVDVHSCAPGSGFLQRCGDDRKTTGKPRLRGGKNASSGFLKKRPGNVGNENAEKSCGFFGWCGSTATAPTPDDGNTASTPRLKSLTAQAVSALPGESSLVLLICVFAAAALLRLAVHRCHTRG